MDTYGNKATNKQHHKPSSHTQSSLVNSRRNNIRFAFMNNTHNTLTTKTVHLPPLPFRSLFNTSSCTLSSSPFLNTNRHASGAILLCTGGPPQAGHLSARVRVEEVSWPGRHALPSAAARQTQCSVAYAWAHEWVVKMNWHMVGTVCVGR